MYVFDEPSERESWPLLACPYVTLELFTGGAKHVERREAGGSWHGEDMAPGELFLHWGNGRSYEARWWSLSEASTQTVAVMLSRELVGRVAQQVTGTDLASLQGIGRARFTDPLLTQVFLALRCELEHPAPAGSLYAQAAAQLLSVHLLRHYSSTRPHLQVIARTPTRLTKRQVQRLEEFIQAHLEDPLSVATLAQQVGFSPHHFAQVFQRATGTSPHQFVLRQRLARAEQLLQETDLPLMQVASVCGFAHQSHLTQVFKRYLGRTPHAYRQGDPRCGGF